MAKKKQPAKKELVGLAVDITGSKQADETLRQSEEKYRNLVETAGAGIATIDAEENITFVNDRLCQLTGYSREDLIGNPFADFVHKDDLPYLTEAFLTAVGGTRHSEMLEFRVIHKNGQCIWVHGNPEPIVIDGQITGFSAIIYDISDRKQLEEALVKSEERYRTILHQMQDTYHEVDLAGNFTFVSESAAHSVGYSREELIGQNYRLIVPEEDIKGNFTTFNEVYRTGKPNKGFGHRILHRNGSIIFSEASIDLNRNTQGEVIGFKVVNRDITGRKQAEEALRESEEQLGTSLENAPDGVYMNDLEGNFLYGNRKCEEITGYKREELIGKNFLELNILPENSLARAAELLQDSINGKSTGPDELELIRKDGRRVPVEISANVVRRKGQAVVLAFVRDISERKKTEMALRENEERIRRLSENAPDVIYRYRLKPVPGFEYLNPASVKITGYTPEEYFADPLLSAKNVHPEDQDRFKQYFRSLESLGTPLTLRWIHKAGHIIWTEEIDVPVYDANGEIIALEGIARDITERKKVESALQESEQQYHRLADYHMQLNDISIVFAEATGTEDLFNKVAETFRLLTGAIAASFQVFDKKTRALKIVSLSIDQIYRDKLDSIFEPEFFEMQMPVSADLEELIISQLITKPKDLCELTLGTMSQDLSDTFMDAIGCQQIVALGITYAKELVGTCIASLQGDQPVVPDDALKTYSYIAGLAVKRKRAEEALQESEAQYSLLSEHTTDVVWLMDMDIKTTYQSPSSEKQRGYTHQEIIDLPLEKNLTPESLKLALEVFFEEIPRIKADPDYNPVYILELEYYRKDGTTFWSENKFSIIRDGSGKAVSILGEGRDITERRKAEEALRESEERFRNMANLLPQTVFETDEKGFFTFVNRQGFEMFGYSEADVAAGMSVLETIIPQDRDRAVENISQRIKGVEFSPQEYTAVRRDGSKFPVTIYASPIILNSTYAGMRGMLIDITERKQVEEAIRESEGRFKSIVEHITDIFYMQNADREILYISPQVEQILGYTLEEMRNGWQQYLTANPMNLAGPEKSQLAFTTGEKQPPYLLEFMHRDGTKRLAEINESPLKNAKGEVIGIVGAARDITERKRIESALKESEEKYRLLVENALEAICIAVDGMFKFANHRAMEITGYSQEELTSRPFIEFIHPDDRQMAAERYLRRLSGLDVPEKFTFRAIFKQGDIRWIELAAVQITWEGRPATLSFMTDITERRRLEEEEQRVAKLESVGLLAGGIAHDFNNILTAILGNISLARMEAAPGSEIHESLEQAEKASLRAKELTKQLLTFSKGGAPIKKLASLTELLRDTAGFALRGSNVKCHFSIPADLWHAEIDAGQVSQVIQNLVINAQQAMPAGGTIELTAENMTLSETQSLGRGLPLKEGNYIRIAVTDNGSGIPAEHLDRIFDPFFSTKKKGSGLGLATSFSIARQHGGHLSVESELGSGSTFYFYLPASTETSTPRQDKKVVIKPAGKARILVMDDEKGVREVAGRMLKHIGYEDVEFAVNGAEAIKLYKAAMESGQPFSVVILDLTIPGGMGGRETVSNLLKIDPGVKAIVSSGYADDSIMAGYKENGFSVMVAKPYTLEQLGKAVHDLIG